MGHFEVSVSAIEAAIASLKDSPSILVKVERAKESIKSTRSAHPSFRKSKPKEEERE